ncbi:hypothetical protein J2Z22_002415 [Paenibacillus forsythiae]|uniref:Copper amine oxidase-like N-terminal domain-containing protein n=1 Tax=Paenibacillus forsythiae TaxID=365616 RepID=A0ABU3H7S7_9BACL|nr:hypothetical protein [Paenibacillus forsythiae]MDT3426881.1 hypothetical protein [Paenibacillus forsythiae]
MKFSSQAIRRTLLGAAVLLALSVQGLPSVKAQSEINVYDSAVDASKGMELYSTSYTVDGKFENAVVYKQQDGTYAKWQEPFRSFHTEADGSVIVYGYDPEATYVYDPDRQAIVQKNVYMLSPDGKWGFLWRFRYNFQALSAPYGAYYSRLIDYYLKNMETGEVSLYKSSERSFSLWWYDQHTLLESGYDNKAKQNMITAYNPDTNKRTTLLAGKLYNFNPSNFKLLYAENEPLRIERVYDLKTGSSHILNDEAERDALYPPAPARTKPSLPAGINPAELPVVPVPLIEEYEYTAEINGLSIPLSTVFQANGKRWIPVGPLTKALGWKAELLKQPGSSNKAPGYQYTISKEAAKLTLTPSNSFSTGNRLFMTDDQLKSLGYGPIKLVPHTN